MNTVRLQDLSWVDVENPKQTKMVDRILPMSVLWPIADCGPSTPKERTLPQRFQMRVVLLYLQTSIPYNCMVAELREVSTLFLKYFFARQVFEKIKQVRL